MPALRSVSTFVRDGYIKVSNPDLIPSSKLITVESHVGSGEKLLSFGELQVHDVLKVEGEVSVLTGTTDQTVSLIASSISENTTLYGIAEVESASAVEFNAEVTIL